VTESGSIVGPPQSKAASREPVTRDRAVQVAVGLADAGGLESLSMRKLAQELRVEAMSLYYHVKSKDDLIDGMVDVVFSEIVLPSPGDDWKPAMRQRAESARAVLARHPWAIALMRSTPGAATLTHLDATIGCLRSAGFSPAMAGHAMSLLDSFVDGFALQEASLPLDPAGGMTAATEDILAQQQMMTDAFPHLAEIAESYILRPSYAFGNEFLFGLRIILDGIEAAHTSEEP
jgi:AcrR family transcriptional regulator